ncbi:MAG: hypothetical protein IJZ23_07025 [Roseburia sp.]|nr:hypothetical protein [Roseburia sp.]MBQ8279577.1 hypothetical protein [Roseburia sp.]
MKPSARMEILRLKGTTVSHKFIEWYEKEWTDATNRLKESGADLSQIVLVQAERTRK